MSVTFEDVNEKVRHVIVTGRLDVPGTDAIADEFSRLVNSAPGNVMVDLAAVSFLGSIGVRALISAAKEVEQRGRRMVLVTGDDTVVKETLEAMGIDQLIPVFEHPADASRELA